MRSNDIVILMLGILILMGSLSNGYLMTVSHKKLVEKIETTCKAK